MTTALQVVHGGRAGASAGPSKLYDLTAEAAILGNVLYAGAESLAILPDGLTPERFYSEAHRRTFEAAKALQADAAPVTTVTVQAWLRDQGRLAQVQAPYLNELVVGSAVLTHGELRKYAAIVVGCWGRRRAKEIGLMLAAKAEHGAAAVEHFTAETKSEIDSLASDCGMLEDQARAINVVKASVAAIRDAATGRATAVPTGFVDADNLIGGMRCGELAILGARPGMGKTSLASQIALRTAEGGIGVFVSSLETKIDFMTRALASRADLVAHRVLSGQLQADEWSALTKSAVEVAGFPLWVDHEEGLTVQRLWSRVRNVQLELAAKKRRLGLVVVDYLQLLRSPRAGMSREEVVSENARGLKAMAGDLDVAVLALAQLNRMLEQRKDKRPQLSDLRESGEIEQCARLVFLLHRPDYHARDQAPTGEAELDIAKHNNGAVGLIKLRFDAPKLRFYDGADEWGDPEPVARGRDRYAGSVAARTQERDDDP